MWIIAGLGNPGRKYLKTRHNIGFRVIDHLAERCRIPLEERELYERGRGAVEGQPAVLLKPLTFMNRSGLAIKRALKKSGALAENREATLIVVHDDLDMDTGIIKIKKGGSSGGHRGIESIITELGTRDFIRVKIGIGRNREIPVEKYVLSAFTSSENTCIKDAIIRAADAVAAIVTDGLVSAMNRYNRSAAADK
jgi:PTH1 family peptidyl-tRNA hydrolase